MGFSNGLHIYLNIEIERTNLHSYVYHGTHSNDAREQETYLLETELPYTARCLIVLPNDVLTRCGIFF